MPKIIDGKNAALGRLASYVAKSALKGEEIIVVNCQNIIITGNKKNILENFEIKRSRVGSVQKGPKHSRKTELIVKRAIRGMIPDFRKGRGKEVFKKIKCYKDIPEEFRDLEKISLEKKYINKAVKLGEISK